MTTARTVQINVIGNSDSAQTAIHKVAGEAESAGGRINKAFSGTLGILNQGDMLGPFGSALDGISSQFDRLEGKAKSFSKVALGAGAVGMGLGGALSALAGPEQASAQQLQTAISDVGQAYDDFGTRIEETVKRNENLAISSKDTNNALGVLVTGTHDTGKALDYMSLATNLAAKQHIDLSAAAMEVVKVLEGKGTKVLAQFGITTKNTADNGKLLADQLTNLVSGQAQARVDTFMGRMDVWKTKIEDQTAQFGQKWGPALMGASAAITLMGGAWDIAAAGVAAFDVGAIIAIGTMAMIVVAVVAVIAIGYEIYKHWGTIWRGIKSAVDGAWVGIKWVGEHIKSLFMDVVHWFEGMPSKIGKIFMNVGKAIGDGVIWGLNKMIDFIDSFHIPSVNVFGLFSTPGWGGFGIPHIPMLAQGGIVNSPTIAMIGEAGPEAVVPLSRAGGLGGGVTNINIYSALVGDPRTIAKQIGGLVRDDLIRHGRGLPNVGLA